MPTTGALVATITANADPMRAEFNAVQQAAQQAGKNIKKGLEGGGHVGQSSIIRESLVLIREISRGNYTRVPGSLSILLMQLASAPLPIKAVVGGVLALGAAFAGGYWEAKKLVTLLSDNSFGDSHVGYIANHIKAINAAIEGQKEINLEVLNTTEHYNSAAQAASRMTAVIKEQYDHLRKMNEFEKDPRRKIEQTLAINQGERAAMIQVKLAEQAKSIRDSERQKAAADAINVPSKKHDDELLAIRKKEAEEAQKRLDANANTPVGQRNITARMINEFAREAWGGINGGGQPTDEDLMNAERKKDTEDRRRIQAARQTEDQNAANEVLRQRKELLTKQAAASASNAAALGLDIPNLTAASAQKAKDDLEEAIAGVSATKNKVLTGSVNDLQRHGAYTAPGQLEGLNLQKQQLATLIGMRTMLERLTTMGPPSPFGGNKN